jgi:hypothetical protein
MKIVTVKVALASTVIGGSTSSKKNNVAKALIL